MNIAGENPYPGKKKRQLGCSVIKVLGHTEVAIKQLSYWQLNYFIVKLITKASVTKEDVRSL